MIFDDPGNSYPEPPEVKEMHFFLNSRNKTFHSVGIRFYGVGCVGCSRRRQSMGTSSTEWGGCSYNSRSCPWDFSNHTKDRPSEKDGWREIEMRYEADPVGPPPQRNQPDPIGADAW